MAFRIPSKKRINRFDERGWFPCRICGKKGTRYKTNPCIKCKRENPFSNLEPLEKLKVDYALNLIARADKGGKISKKEISLLEK